MFLRAQIGVTRARAIWLAREPRRHEDNRMQNGPRPRLVALVAVLAAAAAAAAATTVAGCKRGGELAPGAPLRLGMFPNVTHAAGLIALDHGDLARRVGAVETKMFNAGPEAMEALFAGALDATYVGPGPALNGWVRSDGQALVIIAGAASGGASFMVAKDSGIDAPEKLHGKRIATPQLGNTQDIALRVWLAEHGLKTREQGGDVQVLPMANPDILTLFRTGKLDGAWVPEPWGARLTDETGARMYLDERTLCPNGKILTVVLVARRELVTARPELVQKLVAAHVDAVRWALAHPDDARKLTADAIERLVKKRLPDKVFADAYSRVDLTWDPLPDVLSKNAADARKLGYLKGDRDAREAVDRRFLDAVLAHD
jgi:sulfonate transport system substrate-binding protein